MYEKNERIFKRIIATCIITLCYCAVWMLLELIIDGQVLNRKIDNIIMLLFIPIIFIATKNMIR